MRTMTETINSIKIIKLNSWIERFTEKIKILRDNEIWKSIQIKIKLKNLKLDGLKF